MYVTIKMKNGFQYYGILWTNRRNDDFITVTGTEITDPAGETQFTNDSVELKIQDMEYAYGSREMVCVHEGEPVILDHVNILLKREWDKKGQLPPSWANPEKRKELVNQWWRNSDAEFLCPDGDDRINPETGEMFLEHYIRMDQWVEKQFSQI